MLLIYTVKLDKSLVGDKGKKKSMQKGKYPLSFEIWIIGNSQPDRHDNRRIYVAMSSTQEQYVALFKICLFLNLRWNTVTDPFNFDTDTNQSALADAVAKEKWTRSFWDALRR